MRMLYVVGCMRQQYITWYMISDSWFLIYDIRCVLCDVWHMMWHMLNVTLVIWNVIVDVRCIAYEAFYMTWYMTYLLWYLRRVDVTFDRIFVFAQVHRWYISCARHVCDEKLITSRMWIAAGQAPIQDVLIQEHVALEVGDHDTSVCLRTT